jgi:hypothetical protein
MHILVTSLNGVLIDGLVTAETMEGLKRELNGAPGGEPPKYFEVRHETTGHITLVPNGIGIIAEHNPQ